MNEERLRAATFVALVIVMLANVVAALANWQAYEARSQTQALFAEWKRQAAELNVRIGALEAVEQTKQQRLPPLQQ
jgi:ABC-type enterochelin transport system permease subunit